MLLPFSGWKILICDPPREKGYKLKIFKIDFLRWFDSRVVLVSSTERIFEKSF